MIIIKMTSVLLAHLTWYILLKPLSFTRMYTFKHTHTYGHTYIIHRYACIHIYVDLSLRHRQTQTQAYKYVYKHSHTSCGETINKDSAGSCPCKRI